jgi:branched-subunit amino acid ABC-type transport system permease component
LDVVLQLLLNGLAVGCIYGLVALGFVLIYKATELVNFAQGDLMMLGAFTCYMFVVWYGIGYWLAFALAVVTLAVFGALLDRVILRRVIEPKGGPGVESATPWKMLRASWGRCGRFGSGGRAFQAISRTRLGARSTNAIAMF